MTRTEEPALLTKRSDDRPDEQYPYLNREATIAFAESLRPKSVEQVKGEEKISVFWRIFGGTILSITALVFIQAYQSISGSIQELRADQNRLRETAADYVKKDDLASRTTSLWNRVQELQNLNASVSVASNKMSSIEMQLAAADRDRKEFQSTVGALHGLREKDAGLEKQLRDAEAERKDLVRELQALRERLAKLEALQSAPKTQPPIAKD